MLWRAFLGRSLLRAGCSAALEAARGRCGRLGWAPNFERVLWAPCWSGHWAQSGVCDLRREEEWILKRAEVLMGLKL